MRKCASPRTCNVQNYDSSYSLNSWYSLVFYITVLGPVGASPDPESVTRGPPWVFAVMFAAVFAVGVRSGRSLLVFTVAGVV